MTDTQVPPQFQGRSTRLLRKRGVVGDPLYRLMPGYLEIWAEQKSGVRISVEVVTRMRSGVDYTSKHGPYYETRIYILGENRPLVLSARRENVAAYAELVRGYAKMLAEDRGVDRLECGTTALSSLLPPLLMTPVFIAACAISLFVLHDDAWWQQLAPPAIPGVVLLLLIFGSLRSWPRQARSLEDFCASVA